MNSGRFAIIGDYGKSGDNLAEVASMVRSWSPDFIITTGDNNYPDGAASTIDENVGQYFHDYIFPYYGTYGPGADINRFFPTLGNHDWDTDRAQPYLDYFTLPGNEHYYDFVWGNIHFFALDSDRREPDGASQGSVQFHWLRTRLLASTARWQVVYFHHPPYGSSERHEPTENMKWSFAEWGADVVLAGHNHVYERLQVDGIPYIVNGLGGASRYRFADPVPESIVRYRDDYGAQLVTVSECQLQFDFYSVENGGTLIDRVVLDRCNPAPTSTPTATSTPVPVGTINRVSPADGDTVPALPVYLQWQETPFVSWYYVKVANPINQATSDWYNALDVCGEAVGVPSGTCQIEYKPNVLVDGAHNWVMQGWGSGVMGPLNQTTFILDAGVKLISPAGGSIIQDGLTQIVWQNNPQANWHRVYLVGPNGFLHDRWYEAVNVCADEMCHVSFNDLQNGNYNWWHQGWGFNAGFMPWSNGKFTLEAPVAAPVVKIAPLEGAELSNTVPFGFTWNAQSQATWYHIQILSGAVVVYNQWFFSPLICSDLTCSPEITLGSGTYSWRIRAWGPGGMGSWSDLTGFLVE